MKDETLDDIENDINLQEKTQADKAQSVAADESKKEDSERYEKALEKGYQLMGLLRGGLDKVYPFVTFGDEKEEKDFFDHGAKKAANVLKKYDSPAVPLWFTKYREELEAGVFFGSMGFTVWLQVKEYNKAQEEKAHAETDDKTEAEITQPKTEGNTKDA